jgi:hypothetical protein
MGTQNEKNEKKRQSLGPAKKNETTSTTKGKKNEEKERSTWRDARRRFRAMGSRSRGGAPVTEVPGPSSCPGCRPARASTAACDRGSRPSSCRCRCRCRCPFPRRCTAVLRQCRSRGTRARCYRPRPESRSCRPRARTRCCRRTVAPIVARTRAGQFPHTDLYGRYATKRTFHQREISRLENVDGARLRQPSPCEHSS